MHGRRRINNIVNLDGILSADENPIAHRIDGFHVPSDILGVDYFQVGIGIHHGKFRGTHDVDVLIVVGYSID